MPFWRYRLSFTPILMGGLAVVVLAGLIGSLLRLTRVILSGVLS
ncbi:MAG TPA: hypothetical protein VNM72_13920 [Blastocatellia bacterium]|nr:hypothetical protein [Blastocatellia bacterium]